MIQGEVQSAGKKGCPTPTPAPSSLIMKGIGIFTNIAKSMLAMDTNPPAIAPECRDGKCSTFYK